MSLQYRNKYRGLVLCSPHESAEMANCWVKISSYAHERTELHINGHWHRPAVGMRADQASHAWVFVGHLFSLDDGFCTSAFKLERRA